MARWTSIIIMHDMGGLTAFLIVLSGYTVFSFSGKFQYQSKNMEFFIELLRRMKSTCKSNNSMNKYLQCPVCLYCIFAALEVFVDNICTTWSWERSANDDAVAVVHDKLWILKYEIFDPFPPEDKIITVKWFCYLVGVYCFCAALEVLLTIYVRGSWTKSCVHFYFKITACRVSSSSKKHRDDPKPLTPPISSSRIFWSSIFI